MSNTNVEKATRHMSYNGTGPVETSPDNRTVSGWYRSSLPKEGASDVGEYEYDEMVKKEIASFKQVLEPRLTSFKDKIEKIEYYDEEKSRITVLVRLK